MITLFQMVLDLAATDPAKADDLLWNKVPRWQMQGRFDEVQSICRCTLKPEPLDKQRNALRIEIYTPGLRCTMRSPDGQGLRWLAAGGSATSYGACEPAHCPILNTPLEAAK